MSGAGAELLAFRSNLGTTSTNLESVKSLLLSIYSFIDDAEDLVDYVDRTGTVADTVYGGRNGRFDHSAMPGVRSLGHSGNNNPQCVGRRPNGH